MKIENDIVVFETADFDGLSEVGKKAVSSFFGDFAAYFSAKLTRDILVSKTHLKTLTIADPTIDAILDGLTSASEDKLKEAEPLLAQLDELLNPK